MIQGQRSLLIGVHQFLLHPLLVAIAWIKLYGIPWNPKIWLCFLVHDWGYWFCEDIDGDTGKNHPWFGAYMVQLFCDLKYTEQTHIDDDEFANRINIAREQGWTDEVKYNFKSKLFTYTVYESRWRDFCLYHSRHIAEEEQVPFSRLCVADKLATALLPTWLFIILATLSGEMKEFEQRAKERDGEYVPSATLTRRQWIDKTRAKFRDWAYANRYEAKDSI